MRKEPGALYPENQLDISDWNVGIILESEVGTFVCIRR